MTWHRVLALSSPDSITQPQCHAGFFSLPFARLLLLAQSISTLIVGPGTARLPHLHSTFVEVAKLKVLVPIDPAGLRVGGLKFDTHFTGTLAKTDLCPLPPESRSAFNFLHRLDR